MTDRVYTISLHKSHLDVIFDALLDKVARQAIPIMNNIQVQMAEQAKGSSPVGQPPKEAGNGGQ